MRVRHADVELNEFESPKGNFGVAYRDHVSCEDSGCPFDLQHVTLKAGKKNFPLHTHGSLWELYYVLSGSAIMRSRVDGAGCPAPSPSDPSVRISRTRLLR